MSITKPWLSVIIPFYNAEQFLNRALYSIQRQVYQDFEAILIDDGSTDSGVDLCYAFCNKDKRFRYFHTENGGILHARLLGMKHVNGEYFTFCDADDWYKDKNVFSRLHNKCSESGVEVSVAQFGYVKKYNHLSKGISFIERDAIVDGNDFYRNDYPKLLCSRWEESRLSVNLWNKLYNAKLLESFHVCDKRMFYGEDIIINLHLMESIKNILYIPDKLYVYKQSTGVTSRFSLNAMVDLDYVVQNQLSFIDRSDIPEDSSIRRILFCGLAGSLFAWTREALTCVGKSQAESILVTVLALPSFQASEQYLAKHSEINFLSANLLRNADVSEYMKESEKLLRISARDKVYAIAKQLFTKI